MDHYGRPATVLLCPRCKTELPGNGLRCPKCGPILAKLGRNDDTASFMDFTADYVPLRLAIYVILIMAVMVFDNWHWYAPAFAAAMLIDPWRSSFQRLSWPRGLRYVIASAVLLGGAALAGLTPAELLDFDYSEFPPMFTMSYVKHVLVMFSHCLGLAGLLMWLGALVLAKR